MNSRRKISLTIAGAVLLLIGGIYGASPSPQRRSSSDLDAGTIPGPLVWRGFTEAPAGTVVVTGNWEVGGQLVTDLRIVVGQSVKRGEVIAVLSNYPKYDAEVREREAKLEKVKLMREAMTTGYRTTEITEQEAVTNSAAAKYKLKALEMQRSSEAPDQKQLEVHISQLKLDQERAKLELKKETLQEDLAEIDRDTAIAQSRLDSARISREQSLVRSPIDGLVLEIANHKGELGTAKGIAKIVDMRQMRVLVDVSVEHLNKILKGGKVEVVFRGSRTIHSGTIVRVGTVVKDQLRLGTLAFPIKSDAHLVQVEVKLDDQSSVPQMLGREASVTFLPPRDVASEQGPAGAVAGQQQ